jgi:hypothetical protein
MNWLYKGEEISDVSQLPEDAYGFVYQISTNDGKKYIGRKILFTKRKRKFGKRESARIRAEDKRKKLWEWVIKESNWKTYTGSNKDLNEEIAKGLGYKKEILHFAFNKKQLNYLETKELYVQEVLERPDEYYNNNISGKFFPKDVL